jgi:hypothetical protein
VLLALSSHLPAAELAVLTNENWDHLAPAGKEADCILGDYALRSDRLMAVIGQPLPGRNANMTIREVGGAVIDLTLADRPNDQLGAFYPGMRRHRFNRAEIIQARGPKVVLALFAPAQPPDAKAATPQRPEVRLTYELEDGQPYLLVRSRFTNTTERPLDVDLADDLRADNFDAKVKGGPTDLFWVHDVFFEQAYGLLADGHSLRSRSDVRNSVIEYLSERSEKATITLPPGGSHELVRHLIPCPHLLAVKGTTARLRGVPLVRYGWHFVDPHFRPAAGVEVLLEQGETVYGSARSDAWGWVRADLPREKFSLRYKAIGRGVHQQELDVTQYAAEDVVNTEHELPTPPQVIGDVTDERGQPIPCKVAFKGLDKTVSPNWGPPSAAGTVVHLVYTPNGRFTVPINPGSYEATISYGPEYDVVRQRISVGKADRVPLKAILKRAFATPGWVSTDYHSHSSPSGDNTADQRGRVLNLLCEQIEFAPCTEHNRLDSYVPHLQALGAERLMGTCTGIELTGTLPPLNHHNAFPLRLVPRTQDNGAPLPDKDPVKQIRRLYEWDGGSEKLVQQNHPDIGWLFFDKNGDGKPDSGHAEGFRYMGVIEVHPIHEVLTLEPKQTVVDSKGKKQQANHTVFNWLQLLNQGHRIPGVVNTDAHYNFHGSGGLRNYVRCDAPSPDRIDPLEIVRHSRKGHIIMSTAPFLDVKLNGALPGDDLSLPAGKAKLSIRVSCANWYDIDRVQVLLNGRPDPTLDFTRKSHPDLFHDKPERFTHDVNLALKKDTHVIIVAIGEEKPLGDVMGPFWGKHLPVAISNPIFVDVDGGGFKPNGDTLGSPLPVKASPNP